MGERADYHKESLAFHSSDQLSEPFSSRTLASLCFIMVRIAQSYCTVILPSENSCGLDPILWMTEITVGLLFLARPCYFVKAQTLLVGYTYLTGCLPRIMKHPHLLLSSPRVTVAEYTCLWESTCARRLLVWFVSSFKLICT